MTHFQSSEPYCNIPEVSSGFSNKKTQPESLYIVTAKVVLENLRTHYRAILDELDAYPAL